ncbi:MAG: hypothetical protein K6F52_00805, partial [Clostridia bacterium]|nr:hypothetical protein [Clostridia bacterium]
MYKISELQGQYKAKLISADEAAAKLKDGDRVHYGLGLGCVKDLDAAIGRRAAAGDVKNIMICNTVAVVSEPYKAYQDTQTAEQVSFSSAHFSGVDRKICRDGRSWYIPMQFRELPSYWPTNGNNIDVAMFTVGPMDKYGNFNIGPQVSEMWGVIKSAKLVIVEVNENMPRALGYQSEINLAEVDFVVESSNPPLSELKTKPPTEIDKKIASNVVELVRSGSTLQLGIGGLPLCIGSMIADSDLQDISGHTEMLVDAYLELYNKGKLTGKKNIDKGKLVYTFTGGSKELYDFIDNNPVCCVAPVDYVNSPHVIGQIDNFVSVNGCIQLDLFGQVCSESAGPAHISGTGGQLDFVLGAYLSKGGQSFICTPSTRTFPDGHTESLIAPILPPGSIVTTPRMATHYIATEYGVVNLKGKNTRERAELLISIAHPDFRDELIRQAEALGIWKSSKCVWNYEE